MTYFNFPQTRSAEQTTPVTSISFEPLNYYFDLKMKKQLNTKSTSDITLKIKNFPQCINKKQARMVCLNEGCQQYAFFCLQCDDETCEQIHRHQNHSDKFVAISFKEFVRRVLKEKKPLEELSTAVNTYRDTLERLRSDINEFVERQLRNLDEIIERASEVQQDLLPLVKKLREEKYAGLQGKEMDYLWRNCGDNPEAQKMQTQMADFIKIKEQELKAISQHFQNLNKMELEKISELDEGKNRKTNEQISGKKSPALNTGAAQVSRAGKQEAPIIKK